MDKNPHVADLLIEGEAFLDVAMRPHTCYYRPIHSIKSVPGLHGLAHITGGGLADNLRRILPPEVNAEIDLSTLRIPPLFTAIREQGQVSNEDMFCTFNLGVGIALVCSTDSIGKIVDQLNEFNLSAWKIGEIVSGKSEVRTLGEPCYGAIC